MNWVSFLTRSKGVWHLFQRMWSILHRYGLTPARMTRTLHHLNQVLTTYRCRPTFPITAVALSRHPEAIQSLASEGVEFAVHGLVHVDHSQLTQGVQEEQLGQALRVFAKNNIPCQGFRSPYLQWNSGTLAAIESHGLSYESNQPILWDVLDGQSLDHVAGEAYGRVVDFYAAEPASEHLSLPRLTNGYVQIPVSLPDDEMLVERLRFSESSKIEQAWHTILQQTYQSGELFTLSLHPERTWECHQALANVLADARRQYPPVWIAQLREIADWWRRKQAVTFQITKLSNNKYRLQIEGPDELRILARHVEVDVPTQPWFEPYVLINDTEFVIEATRRPIIGISPIVPAKMAAFLGELGYLVEISDHATNYSLYFDGQTTFGKANEKPLVTHIESANSPLVRLNPWPNGTRSALSVTGDIDALTLWDYFLRMFGM